MTTLLGALAALCLTSSDGLRWPQQDLVEGRQLPQMTLRSDQSETFSLSSLRGEEFGLVPIFTRCRATCSVIARNVVDELSGGKRRIVFLSFDAEDTVEDLIAFRQRFELPDRWVVAAGNGLEVAQMLKQLDFSFVRSGNRDFLHPNVVYAIKPPLTVASFVTGASPQRSEFDRAFKGQSWAGRLPMFLIFFVGLFATIAFLLVRSLRKTRAEP